MTTMNNEDPAGPVDQLVRPLVERLRGGVYGLARIELCSEAADEIERLGDLLGGMDSHGRYWVENRGRIIDAITRAGFDLMSDSDHFWLSKKWPDAEFCG